MIRSRLDTNTSPARGSSPWLTVAVAMGALAAASPIATVEAQAGRSQLPAHEVFWNSLQSLCGKAFAGTVVESFPPDTAMDRARLVMHVRECSHDTVRVPFHVGTNRSRTWVITRQPDALRLKHDHRHEDGTPDPITNYGGDTRYPGLPTHMRFQADSLTGVLVPAARANVWTLELVPGERFAYDLRRGGSDRRFRAEFDLRRPVDPPPPPWGARK